MGEKVKKLFSRRLIVILFLIIYALIIAISARSEYLQYKEIGEQYVSIFFKNLRTEYIVFFVAFIISYLMIFISNKVVRRALKEIFAQEGKEMPRLPNKSISFIASVIVAFIAKVVLTEKFLMFTNVAQFGIEDPIFGMDISFYMFQIPFIKAILIFLIAFLAILTVYICVYYILTINICLDGVDADLLKKNSFLKQLLSNIFIIAVLVAGLMVLSSQEVVNGNLITLNDEARTELVGAGLTEVKIKVIGYRILGVVILFSLFRTIKYFKKFKVKKIVSSMLITPIYLVILFTVMTGFEYLYANKNEFDKQREYIEANIKNTREAYGINIQEVDVDNSSNLSDATIRQNEELLSQITIVDEDTTLANLNEYKNKEGYYTYQSTQLGRYDVDGKNKALYVTPREIVSGANRTYNNKTYQYTHGYGVVISEANKTDEVNGISYIQSKYTSDEDKILIKEPRIYFGMATDDTVVTNVTDKKEFDYPNSTTSYEENEYDGDAGITANLIDRAVLALSEQDYKLLFNTSMNSNSKILMNRNIRERAKVLLPYLIYDESPYMVIRDDGTLTWVIDAYTTSNSYPYSQKTNIQVEGKNKEINYIRNSIKVLIDAYNGTTTFYITDKTDPIAMLYYNIYPELFADKDASIPEDIQKNIVYPEFLYKIQAKMLERYHNVNTEILYRSDDVWKVAEQSSNGPEEVSSEPYYTVLKTLDSNEEELGLVIPYTKSNKQSLNSYLVGTYVGGGNRLVLYKLISDTTLPGIQQMNVQIDQDKTISDEITKINTAGTELIRNTYIIPIENSILYVQPVYQVLLNESKVPSLVKVIVASGTKVAIGDDLKEALTNLYSDSAGKINFINTEDKQQLIDAIIKENNNLKESTETNDWSLIGDDINRLQELIDQLEAVNDTEEIDNEDSVSEE